jgi:hypothetical protein
VVFLFLDFILWSGLILYCVQRLTEVSAVQAKTTQNVCATASVCIVGGSLSLVLGSGRQTAIPDRQRYRTVSDTGQTAIPDRQWYRTDSDTWQTVIPERQRYLTHSDTWQTMIPDRQWYRTDTNQQQSADGRKDETTRRITLYIR